MLSLDDIYALGFEEGYETPDGIGLTFDGDPESPRSEAYDLGRCHGEAIRYDESLARSALPEGEGRRRHEAASETEAATS